MSIEIQIMKDRATLLDRLTRVFPRLSMRNEGHFLDENDYVPSSGVDWSDVLDELDKNSLVIVDKSEVKESPKQQKCDILYCNFCKDRTSHRIHDTYEQGGSYEMHVCTVCGREEYMR